VELSGCCRQFRRESRSKVSAIMTLIVRYPDGDPMNWFCESESLRVNAMNGGRACQTPDWHNNCALLNWPSRMPAELNSAGPWRNFSNDATTAR